MKRLLNRTILLILIVLTCFTVAKSQHFIATADTMGVICESTSNEICFNLQQLSPEEVLRIHGFHFAVLYDHRKVQFESISYIHGAFRDSLLYESVEDTLFLWVDTINFPNPFDSGTLFRVQFTGVETGSTEVGFVESESYLLTDSDEPPTIVHDAVQFPVFSGHLEALLEQTNWGCSYESKGHAYISVIEGTPPFTYEWATSPIQRDTFAQGLVGGEQFVYVTDGNRCRYQRSIEIEVLPAPQLEWETDPENITIEKLIKFNVTQPDGGMNWQWSIVPNGTQDTVFCVNDGERDNHPLRCTQNTEYIFYEAGDYTVRLSANNADGCDTTIETVITVLPIELEFKNVITPNNNRFRILVAGEDDVPLADVFTEHELTIINRVGQVVYHTKNVSHEGWDGGNLSDGTYYYTLKAKTLNKDKKYYYRGNLVILGK